MSPSWITRRCSTRAGFDADAHTLTMADPGLNCLASLDAQCLARIAEALGRGEEAAGLSGSPRL